MIGTPDRLSVRLIAWITSLATASAQLALPPIVWAATTDTTQSTSGPTFPTTTSTSSTGPSIYGGAGSPTVQHLFTGQRYEPSIGLYDYKSRYYDADLGRFLQPDPFIQDPYDPQSLNRYSYVRNNPVNYVDPSGHIWFIAALLIAAVKAAVVGAVVGAAVNASVAAIRGEDVGQAAWRGARAGAASGALLGAGGFAIGAQGLALAGTAKTLTEVGIAAASGAVGGGVESRLQGGSFSNGLLPGVVGGVLGYGASRAIGAVAQRWGLPTPEPGDIGQQVGLMQSFRQWIVRGGSRTGAVLSEDTLPAGNRLSPIRLTQPGEAFERFESTQLSSKILQGGGLKPGTFATRSGVGLTQLDVNQALNVPLKHIPRDVRFVIEPPPGTAIIGPRSIVGGTESEVQFIYGLPRVGAVRGPYRVPRD